MTTPVNTTNTSNAVVNTGQVQLSSDYNTFLQLLTTQLKNQDPLSPMDTNTFTQQLVAMNGVQQQLQGPLGIIAITDAHRELEALEQQYGYFRKRLTTIFGKEKE